jgi:hypothetical protein
MAEWIRASPPTLPVARSAGNWPISADPHLWFKHVPAVFFGTPFVAAGLVLLLIAWSRGEIRRLRRGEIARLVLVQLLMVVLTYGSLLGYSLCTVCSDRGSGPRLEAGEPDCFRHRPGRGTLDHDARRGAGFGFAGLGVLFGPQITVPTDPIGLFGSAAIVFSAIVYSLGSVIARPLTQATSPTFMSRSTLLPGGSRKTLGALEPGALSAAHFDWSTAACCGWLFLVVFGSLIAFTAYMRLIAVWGAAQAGSYAHTSPVSAVLLGVLALGERVGWREAVGMALLLAAAFFSLRTSMSTSATTPGGRALRPQPWMSSTARHQDMAERRSFR